MCDTSLPPTCAPNRCRCRRRRHRSFFHREVLPYTPMRGSEDATKIGYEIIFTRHFYEPQPLRSGGDSRVSSPLTRC